MNTFELHDYKKALKDKLSFLNSTRSSRKITVRGMADKIGIQHTYISRVFNNDGVHFNEDHLYELGHLLEFSLEEIDYLSLLRSYEVSSSKIRKEQLKKKIESIRQEYQISAKQNGSRMDTITSDMNHLLDPYSVVILAALAVDAYMQKPKLLGSILGISVAKLKDVLNKLKLLGYIQFESENFTVTNIKIPHIHYSTDHPLMRAHQQLMRTLCSAHLLKVDDKEKKSFMVTFGADAGAVEEIRVKFAKFLSEIEPLVVNAKTEHAYQLCFDIFEWC
ncbi:DUF4423 domain-containing protein [Bdellovibrio sp. HCB-110]|uniref:DUF4423 domain-containing protein n=1 Tax=Bdellovibrio sp. HCB-110 TaxID=3391182 RepID=UPI0039B40291